MKEGIEKNHLAKDGFEPGPFAWKVSDYAMASRAVKSKNRKLLTAQNVSRVDLHSKS